MATLNLAGLQSQNTLATQYLQTWKPPKTGFADDLFPMLDNLKKTKGDVPYIDPAEFLRYEDTERGNLAKANEITFDWSTNSYQMKKWSEAVPYSEDDVEEGQGLGGVFSNLPLLYSKLLRTRFEVARQVRAAAEVTANATAGALSGNAWDSASGVTIKADIDGWLEQVRLANGMKPNRMYLSEKTARVMFRDPTFTDYVKAQTSIAVLTRQQKLELAQQWLDIPKIFVDEGVYQPAIEGQTPTTLVDILGKLCIIAYVENLSSFGGIGHGMTFRKRLYTRTIRLEEREGLKTELNVYEIQKILNAASIVQTSVLA